MEKFRIIQPSAILSPYIRHYWLLESDDVTQAQRVFNEHIGVTPKEFLRIVRFHKTLFTLQNNPSMRFTTLAHTCGYYDQAHMTNEFKLFSGYSPREYVAVCAPYSDYFSD